ncbi:MULTISPECIES: GntR family transcriptional regulator [Paenibacillus]|uniref:GntR family transcriptional regulator n=1 Tax=Paenibacillus naphthalenovorans TaxID=162209 RepID=A0A0U2ILH3_9BACL|nr:MULTISPECIES: GntR family transcriptional regulator [Paenibacillus]ALS20795.1 GntR family transcriptional regulator [Paenibacillus naphthalenovorans]GCL70824.1 GntR family transcriptional regulator [Paenibacillus naphthalenovorans]SDI21746.1 DNA-binding transcriptional regulator, GntR family [Paenibacillus naphthalenovorans]
MAEEFNTKVDGVYEYIFDAIKRGDFHSDKILSERELGNLLGVSRTPIREAFRKLEKEGLVQYEPHKGVRVISFSHEKIRHLYEVREMLEGLGARLLSQHPNQSAIQRLHKLLEQAEQAAEQGNIALLSKINAQFHMGIASGSENVYLIHALQTLQSHITIIMAKSLSQSGRPVENLKEHWLILNAIESRDPELAEVTAKFHIRNAYSNAIKQLDRRNEDNDAP